MKCSTVNADSVAGAIGLQQQGKQYHLSWVMHLRAGWRLWRSRDFVFLKTENGKAIEDIDLQLLLMFGDR